MSWNVTECHRLSWYVYIPYVMVCLYFLCFANCKVSETTREEPNEMVHWGVMLWSLNIKIWKWKQQVDRMEPLSFSADGLRRFSSKWANDRYLELLYLMISSSEEMWRRLDIFWWYVFSLYCFSFWMKRVWPSEEINRIYPIWNGADTSLSRFPPRFPKFLVPRPCHFAESLHLIYLMRVWLWTRVKVLVDPSKALQSVFLIGSKWPWWASWRWVTGAVQKSHFPWSAMEPWQVSSNLIPGLHVSKEQLKERKRSKHWPVRDTQETQILFRSQLAVFGDAKILSRIV